MFKSKKILFAIICFITIHTDVFAYVDKYSPRDTGSVWDFYLYLILMTCVFIGYLIKKSKNKIQDANIARNTKIIDENYNQSKESFNKLLDDELLDFDKFSVIPLVKSLCQRSLIATIINNRTVNKSYVVESIILALKAIIEADEKPIYTKEAKQILDHFNNKK